jgi:uncharacterized protein (TIGR03083 family)
MKYVKKIDVVERFPPLRVRLLELLASLSSDDWSRRTAAPAWSVKDIAVHLLGGDMGILSRERDRFRPPNGTAAGFGELVNLVNRLNDEWVVAARRISPRLLCELLAFTGPQVESYFSSLDLDAMGEPVAWAGSDSAPVWFDVAREFTERWHHQQQIRDATANGPLYDPYFLMPVFQTFVRALPYSFRNVLASSGTVVRFEISGNAGGVWFLVRTGDTWRLAVECDANPVADVILPADVAWRMFTKGIDWKRAKASAAIRGDIELASPVFKAIAVIG